MKQLTARPVVILLTAAFGIASAAQWLVSHSHPPIGPRSRVSSRQEETRLTAPGAPTVETPKLFPVSKDGKTGFIDKTGELIIPLKFPLLYVQGDFSDGMARVAVKKEGDAPVGVYWQRIGYINAAGEVAIPPQFDEAEDFSEGLALVRIDGRYVFIDRAGRVAIQKRFLAAQAFSEGLAGVCEEGGGCGYIDKAGAWVMRGAHIRLISQFSEGLAPNMIDARSFKLGYIDKTGRLVIEGPFDSAGDFSEGLAIVTIDRKMGFIDKTGRAVIEPRFDDAHPFSDGLARVTVGGKFGYIDKTGSMVIGAQYSAAGEFSEGLAPVEINDRWGYIDKAGKVVIKPRFDSAGEFVEGIAPVMTGAVHADVPQTGAKNGYIDRTGRYVWRPTG